MAPVRKITVAQALKDVDMKQNSKQPQMQHHHQQQQQLQQQHKRQQRHSSRYRPVSGGGSGGGFGQSTPLSSAVCVRRPQSNGHIDYTVSTNQQPSNCSGGAILKTPKATSTGEGGGYTNRHLSKVNINNNNIINNTSSTEATTTAAAEAAGVQRKRQHSPTDKRFKQINGSATAGDAHFDINNIAAKSPEVTVEEDEAGDDIVTHFTQLRKLLNEHQTTTQTTRPYATNALLKLTKANNNPLLPLNILSLAASLAPTTQTPPIIRTAVAKAHAINSTHIPFSGGYIDLESLLLQRLQLIKHLINLTTSTVNQGISTQNQGEDQGSSANLNSFIAQQQQQQQQRRLQKSRMVNENKPESMERDVVVNSTSLEDVAHSELGENRAQSIQSLHSVETAPTPTPDDSPSFEELQERLETSNRNIQNMQEQQQQLLRLQNAAKQHLSEMEHLRQQAGNLSFGANQVGGANDDSKPTDGAPDYESIDQVHSDMATLVGRMKNLTHFIQNQNELSNLLGDDGPEILAEQEALQRKLESLRAQRDDMRSLVSELQSINLTAERRVAKGDESNEKEEVAVDNEAPTTTAANVEHNKGGEEQNTNTERGVPISYTRNVPIKLVANGGAAQSAEDGTNENDGDGDDDDPAAKAATARLIQQKVADIETMRKQLSRRKEMMDTVNMIEERATHDDSNDNERDVRSHSRSTGGSSGFERDCTPISVVPAHRRSSSGGDGGGGDDVYLTRKMRMLNEVTSDLRAQAESLQNERDRIKALKEDIILRKQQAAAAAQLGEDALKRSSLTPTPTPCSRKQRDIDTPSPPLTYSSIDDPLKREYEAKKKEFEILCQRLQQQDGTAKASQSKDSATNNNTNNAPRRRDTVSEADDEADGDEELNDSDFPTSNATSAAAAAARQYFTAPQQQSTPAQQHRAAVKAAVTAHTAASAASKVNANTHSQQCHHHSQRLGKEDSFETNLTSSSAGGERRHSTLANATNTTQDGASLEAGSVQSGSSAFTMPPPMPPMAGCSSWPPMPPLPNTWNPQFYYGFGASTGSNAHTQQPNSITTTTTQSGGAQFTPIGLLQQSSVNSDCMCSAANSSTNAPIVHGPTPTVSSTNTAAAAQQLAAADPVLLHQFVQTQQMLINSVCQCNQMLWHQQREIDGLNNTIHVLQERLHAITGSSGINDIPFSIRSESVPPPPPTLPVAAGITIPNNLYLNSTNRAQSEQPTLFMPGGMTATGSTRNSAFANYQAHHQQYQQRQQHGHVSTAGVGIGGTANATNSYNFSSETHQHSNIATASSTNAGLYSTLNNAAVQQQQQPPPPANQGPPLYNNEIPQSPPLQSNAAAGGPGPIFMHHHNNAIHQNNANLRTQNHYANNLHQQQQHQPGQQHGHSNLNIGCNNTLNNQVPPGNRANNYWDNFRSYSRQNLLSTNSNKSNEEQQHNQQHQQQQQQHQQGHEHFLRQRIIEQLEPATDATHYRAQPPPLPQRGTTTMSSAVLTTSNLQQLQRQQQGIVQQQQQGIVQQQQQHQQQPSQRPTQPQLTSQQLYHSSIGGEDNINISNSCNNLNFERNANSHNNNKYLRTLQRSHINRYQQQQQQNLGHTANANNNNLYQSTSSWLQHPDADATAANACSRNNAGENNHANIEIYEGYNIIDSDLATPYSHLNSSNNSSNMLRNMNVNYGNSPHYQRNKLLAKPNCRVANTAETAMEQHNVNRARQLQQQQQQQQHHILTQQQQLALHAQQQLDRSTLRPIPNMAAFKSACYLDLLPAANVDVEAIGTQEECLRNRDHIGMLLRTVAADNVDDDGKTATRRGTQAAARANTNATINTNNTYNTTYVPNAVNGMPLLDTNEIGNNTPNIDNENPEFDDAGDVNGVHHAIANNVEVEEDELGVAAAVMEEDEEDNTTSEEIKRNLLVNALKNDKFTTKFYESIKEDVFRRLERILLERETAVEGNCQGRTDASAIQLCNGLINASANAIDVPNEILGVAAAAGGAVRDPTRKFNLNARMGNQQQQKRLHHQYQQQQQHHRQQQQYHQLLQQQQFYQHPQNSSSAAHHFASAHAPATVNCNQSKEVLPDDNEQAAEDDQQARTSASAVALNANHVQAARDDENAEEDEFGANNADTESNKADNEDPTAATTPAATNASNALHMAELIQERESEQPEEDNAPYNNNNNNNNGSNDIAGDISVAAGDALVSISGGRAEGNIANWRKNMLVSHAEPSIYDHTNALNNDKKRINQSKSMNNSGAGGDAEAMPIANSASNHMRSTYYTDLIAYIITRIRNQTHTNTQINDTLLVEIAKLTASAVQNFAPTLVNYRSLSGSSPHISPKKVYMKIKKLSVPRQRDEFLQWYQNYLENLFPGARLEAERRREEMRRNSGVGATGSAAALDLPRNSDEVENQNQLQHQRHVQQLQQKQKQQQPQHQREHEQSASINSTGSKGNNDEDLAEADQNSANSSSNNTADMLDVHTDEAEVGVQQQPNPEKHAAAAVMLMRQHENELENNENPDDDDVHQDEDGARCAPNAVDQCIDAMDGVAAGSANHPGVPYDSAARTAAAAITEDAINAAVQRSDLLHRHHYTTKASASAGECASHNSHNT